MNKYLERIYNGIVKENPCMVLMLGMCPTLAVTTSATNGVGMGLSTTVVLIASNMIISALRKVIPDDVRLPSYIVIVATLVTTVELLMEAYLPALNDALGIYIPLIVVNCIILGRAEAYANKNSIGLACFDGIGMGLGFTIALGILGLVREFIGAGTAFGVQVLPESIEPIGIFVKAPGAFMVIAFMVMIMNAASITTRANDIVEEGCAGSCGSCGVSCAARKEETSVLKAAAAKTSVKPAAPKTEETNKGKEN
ncbi:electron transport complex protein RnfE [Lachnospiraceae bacterium KH1T2]|nr:electron transport complex protein RnfE [Lachnospiraceae bacterium KH1T2]